MRTEAPSDTSRKTSASIGPLSGNAVSRPQYCFRVGIRALLTNADFAAKWRLGPHSEYRVFQAQSTAMRLGKVKSLRSIWRFRPELAWVLTKSSPHLGPGGWARF